VPSDDHVNVIEQDQILTVELSRPDKRNAISPEITDALWQAVLALGDRDDLRCLVIAATGEYFTAGIDLSRPFGARHGDPATRHLHPGWNLRRSYRSHHLLYDELEAVEKPVVVAVQGHCFGAGVEMAASADFRFCTPRATFKLPEVEIGVVPGSGGVSRLTRIIGPAQVKWMAMAAMPVTADEAHAMGLVNRVFPEPTFRDEVHAFCRHLVGLPAEAVGVAKLLADMAVDTDRTTQRHVDRLANTPLLGSEENRRLTARFRAPRAPEAPDPPEPGTGS
jgi:enoyl-CoA hydratase/carnithine racemase